MANIEIIVVMKNINIEDITRIKNGATNPVCSIDGYTENAIGINISAHTQRYIYKLLIFICLENMPILIAATSELNDIAPVQYHIRYH